MENQQEYYFKYFTSRSKIFFDSTLLCNVTAIYLKFQSILQNCGYLHLAYVRSFRLFIIYFCCFFCVNLSAGLLFIFLCFEAFLWSWPVLTISELCQTKNGWRPCPKFTLSIRIHTQYTKSCHTKYLFFALAHHSSCMDFFLYNIIESRQIQLLCYIFVQQRFCNGV